MIQGSRLTVTFGLGLKVVLHSTKERIDREEKTFFDPATTEETEMVERTWERRDSRI